MNYYTSKIYSSFWLIFFGAFICFSMIAGIILGSYGAAIYRKAENDERLFRPWETTCLLLDYQSIKYNCKSCGEDGCIIYTCHNQIYKVTYPIFNGTYINTTIFINNKQIQNEMKIGENYTCYYDEPHDITFVKWNYTDKKTGLIMLCVGYGILGINILILFFISLYRLFEKLYKKWINKSKDILVQIYHVQRDQNHNYSFSIQSTV